MASGVPVERGQLRFMAAHMATFRGQAEPLHGHNYAVIVECVGPLTEDFWVIDFAEAKVVMKALCERLDHKFLLQRPSGLLAATEPEESWELVGQGRRRYVCPKCAVVAPPVGTSPAEEIARWLHGEFCRALRERGLTNIPSVTVGVEEAPGQTGWFTGDFSAA